MHEWIKEFRKAPLAAIGVGIGYFFGALYVLAVLASIVVGFWRWWSPPKPAEPVQPVSCSAKTLSKLKAWPTQCARIVSDAQYLERTLDALKACAHEHDNARDCETETKDVKDAAADYDDDVNPGGRDDD